jgi:Cd2+/Zn2+-exporting ATPase
VQESGKKSFVVSGVCCSTEEALVRKKLDLLVGSERYTFNPTTCELSVPPGITDAQLLRELRSAGFGARRKQAVEPEQSFRERNAEALFTAAATLLTIAGFLIERFDAPVLFSRGVFLGAILVGGRNIFVKAFKAARNAILDMNVLMSLAVLGALFIGKWAEGAAVIVLFSLALALESYSITRTRNAIRSLMQLSPDKACRLSDDGETWVDARDLEPGETIVLRPGERIPLDGTVIDGRSSVDQSPLTGEAAPVLKEKGADVFAGSINQRGSLQVRVTRRFEDTTLSRMIHLVEESHQKRAPVQHFVDRFARLYTPAVVFIAVGIAIVPPLLVHQSFDTWFYRALVLLVIACPCALVISTPVTIVSAITRAARHGILIKGGKYIEILSRVRAVAFDKTGTLTEGRTSVADIIPLDTASPDEILLLVAAIEHHSEHHLAAAVLTEVERRKLSYTHIPVTSFEALPGYGIKATVGNVMYYVGNPRLCQLQHYNSPRLESMIGKLQKQGQTVTIIGKEQLPIGIVVIEDTTRHQSKTVIDHLKRIGIDHIVLLSGDHATSVAQIAHAVGIEEYAAGLLPAEKVEMVEQLKQIHGSVAMVGDGINDAPALAASSVGIAMGVSGTDAALENADAVLMGDTVEKLPGLFGMSRKAMTIIKQNVALALSLKLLFLILTLTGSATLWMALVADDGAALAVILNGLRMLSHKDGV